MGVANKRWLPGVAGVWLMLISLMANASNPGDLSDLVEQNAPAVVNISTTTSASKTSPHGFSIPDLPDDSPLNEFFKKFFEGSPEMPSPKGAQSLGSGFIVSGDGYILTNAHVVKDADQIIVGLHDRREFIAKLVGADERSDVAVLKIDARNLPTVRTGNMENVKVGQWVLAIGSPFGFRESATQGIVSALNRSLPSDTYVPFIQTDVAVNPGNSGGPLFNMQGEVIGLNSQIYSRSGGYQGVSFAIPIDVALRVMNELRANGFVSRGWLGVLIQEVDHDLADSFNLPKPEGALVAQLTEDSPAAKAGIRVGDIIMRYNGAPVESSATLPPMVGRTPAGTRVPVVVLRNGQEMTVNVMIGELEREKPVAQVKAAAPAGNRLNVEVANLTAEERDALGGDKRGVMVKVVGEGAAAVAGIRPGDIILAVASHDVTGAKQFESLVKGLPGGKTVPILVHRDERALFMAVKVPSK